MKKFFDKSKFSNILETINNKYNNMTEFAKIAKFDRSYISKYIHIKLDNPPSPKILERIAKASKGVTNYDELMQVCGYTSSKDIINIKQSLFNSFNDFYAIPVFIVENGKLCETNQDVVLPFKWDGIHQYFGYRHFNDEMAPLLRTKDTAIIEKCDTYVSGKTYLIQLDVETHIRKIIQKDNEIELEAINPYFPIIKLTNEDLKQRKFIVLGRLIRSEVTFE